MAALANSWQASQNFTLQISFSLQFTFNHNSLVHDPALSGHWPQSVDFILCGNRVTHTYILNCTVLFHFSEHAGSYYDSFFLFCRLCIRKINAFFLCRLQFTFPFFIFQMRSGRISWNYSVGSCSMPSRFGFWYPATNLRLESKSG